MNISARYCPYGKFCSSVAGLMFRKTSPENIDQFISELNSSVVSNPIEGEVYVNLNGSFVSLIMNRLTAISLYFTLQNDYALVGEFVAWLLLLGSIINNPSPFKDVEKF
uniref:Uncharacterized protein n=1 Tax=Oxera neriifolia associated virus TaxID=2933183 RepID=A0A9C7LLR3_9VIRU|nr:hypothetical protein [Oxera neriifolia associated virus]